MVLALGYFTLYSPSGKRRLRLELRRMKRN